MDSPTSDAVAVNTLRESRFLYALVTSGTSKILALLVQVLALPLALHVMGEGRYAAFLTLQSLVGWISIFGLGLVPSLPKFISAARALGSEQVERNLIVSAVITMLVISCLVLLGLSLLGLVISPTNLVSAHGVSHGELQIGYFAASFVSCLALFASITPAIRAGSQELHRTNISALLANIGVLAGLLFMMFHPLPLWGFFVVLNMPTAVALLIDLLLLFRQRPYLTHGSVEYSKTVREISSHSNNALLIQASFAMMVYFPTLIMAHLSNSHETAIFGSIALAIFFALASMNLIFQPLTQAMANAHSHDDVAWMAHSYKTSLALICAIGFGTTLLGGTVGPWVIRIWLGSGVQITHLMGMIFGFYFFLLCVVLLHFYVLSASGALPGKGKIYIFQGILALSLGSILCLSYGALGMVLGLALGLSAVAWVFPLTVRRELQAMRSAQQS